MERSRDDMSIPWRELWTVTDLSITDIFQFNSSNIAEDCMDSVREHMPQITDLEVTLTGSRKECSWICKLFRTDTDQANLEADFLISLKDQTLRADERDLLEPIKGKAGFVRLKYPYRLWLNSFQDFADENAYLIQRTDTGGCWEYVSGQQCREWVKRVQDANNPFTESSIYWEILIGSGLFEDDSEVTLSGPAVNASFNKSLSSLLNMVAYCYKNYMHDSDPRLFEILTENYTLCLDTTRLIQRCVAGVTGSAFPGMDLQMGVIEYEYGAPIDTQDRAAQLCEANHTLFETVTRLQVFCAEIGRIYCVNFNGIPVTSQLRHQQIGDPGSSSNDQASFQEQLQYFKKAVSIVADIKWHLEQDIYHEAIFLDGHMGIHQNMFENPLMMNNSYEADYVFCVKCDFWPEDAKEWITRKRASRVPSEDLVDKVVRGGIHIVPKSFPGAGDEALCWRYSFSIPEITLVQNWTKVQRFAYLIVKSIYYEQLYVKLGDEKGKFSSYHIKTIMLWAVEKNPADWWNPDDITPCIQRLLDDIITALETRQLAHYFLREINLLEDSDKSVTNYLLYKAKQVVDCIRDYPARERIEQISTNIHKLQVVNQQLTKLKQVLTFREAVCIREPKTPSFLMEQLFGADVLETGLVLEPVMGLHDMHVKDFAWQVIQQHTSGEQTIQDVLTQQEPSPHGEHTIQDVLTQQVTSPDGEHTNWLELIQDFLVQHVNLPGHGSVQELELDQDSTQILKEVASRAYLTKLLRYLIAGDLHPAVFAMCRRLNLSDHFLEYLTRRESEQIEHLKLFSIGDKAARAFVLDTEHLTTRQNVSNCNSERILTYHRRNTDQENDIDEECTPGSIGHMIQEGIQKWNALVSSEQAHLSQTLEEGLTSEQRSTLTDYILPVLSCTDSEEFHTRMTLQLLKALEDVVTIEDPFSPVVLAVLSLLHTVQCNYEQRLMAAFQSARENYKWHIPGGLD